MINLANRIKLVEQTISTKINTEDPEGERFYH